MGEREELRCESGRHSVRSGGMTLGDPTYLGSRRACAAMQHEVGRSKCMSDLGAGGREVAGFVVCVTFDPQV